MTTRVVPVPPRLRAKRAWRRFPPVRACRVLRQIIDHPSNRAGRVAAVTRAVHWQVRSRLSPAPHEVEVWGGQRLLCYPRSNSASNVIYFTERFDPAEMAMAERVVHRGDVVIDAGANIGVYTLLLASLVGPGGRVYAIEPDGVAFERLRENVERNGLQQVELVKAAVGAVRGTATMTAGSDVSNTLTVGPGTHEVTPVDVVRLDDVVEEGKASFIKLDVEGFEHEALKGASGVLRSRPVIQVELTEHLLRRAGTSALEIVKVLLEDQYRVVWPNLDTRGRLELTAEGSGNAYAVPEERWDALARSLR